MLKIYNSVLKESPTDSPFAPNMPCDLLSGLGSVASSLLGGIFGNKAQKDSNETNLQAVRETNAMNRQLHESDIAQQERMWKLQTEYNNPANAIERLKRAGINPAYVADGLNTPASAMSVPGAQPMQPGHVEPVNAFANSIQGAFSGAVNAYNQSRLATAEIKKSEEMTHGIHLENEEKLRGMSDRLEYLAKMAKHEGYIGELAKTQLAFELKAFNIRQAMLGADYTMQLKQIDLAQEQFNSARLQNELYKIQIAYAPKLNEAQLKQYYSAVNQLKAQVGLINANTLLTEEQRKHEIEKKCGTIIDNGMKGLGYDIQKQTKDFIINMSEQESISSTRNNEYYNFGPVSIPRRYADFWRKK